MCDHRLSGLPRHRLLERLATTTGYNVRDLGLLSPNANDTRVALVGMRVARNQRDMADSSGFAGIINLLEHRRTATVTALADG